MRHYRWWQTPWFLGLYVFIAIVAIYSPELLALCGYGELDCTSHKLVARQHPDHVLVINGQSATLTGSGTSTMTLSVDTSVLSSTFVPWANVEGTATSTASNTLVTGVDPRLSNARESTVTSTATATQTLNHVARWDYPASWCSGTTYGSVPVIVAAGDTVCSVGGTWYRCDGGNSWTLIGGSCATQSPSRFRLTSASLYDDGTAVYSPNKLLVGDPSTLTSSYIAFGVGSNQPNPFWLEGTNADSLGVRVQNDSCVGGNPFLALIQGGPTGWGLPIWQNASVLEGQCGGGLAVGAYTGPLKFYASSVRVEQMRLTPDGRLGIGTTVPTASLDVGTGKVVGGNVVVGVGGVVFNSGTATTSSTYTQVFGTVTMTITETRAATTTSTNLLTTDTLTISITSSATATATTTALHVLDLPYATKTVTGTATITQSDMATTASGASVIPMTRTNSKVNASTVPWQEVDSNIYGLASSYAFNLGCTNNTDLLTLDCAEDSVGVHGVLTADNITQTPTAYAIPEANSSGKLDSWITGAGAGRIQAMYVGTNSGVVSSTGDWSDAASITYSGYAGTIMVWAASRVQGSTIDGHCYARIAVDGTGTGPTLTAQIHANNGYVAMSPIAYASGQGSGSHTVKLQIATTGATCSIANGESYIMAQVISQ